MEKRKNISLGDITITDKLWTYYMNLITDAVLPYQYKALNDQIPDAPPSGAVHNFKVAAGLEEGGYIGRVFQDSDLGKWIEAAAYSLIWKPDPKLEALVDEAIDLIGKAQWEDGYVNTYFTIAKPGKRFTNLGECHELYCFGHLTEAAVAWHEATGKRKLLDIMSRYADLICHTFGPEEGKLHGYDGHQEAELALVKLYRATGNRRYLDMASYFLTERGKEPSFLDDEWEKRGKNYYFYPIPPERRPSDNARYNQSHMPPTEQSDAVGHAVRFAYMCTGMSDVACETGSKKILEACGRLWESAVERNMYITGAIGSSRHGEAFTFDYDLPNDRVYGETCASIGMVFFANSMLQNDPDSRYADVMETELYNTILAAISTDGTRYFYVNPLEVNPDSCLYDPDMVKVKPVRQRWYTTACCPPNIARLLASLGKYVYFQSGDTIYANLYISSEARFSVGGESLRLDMKAGYPWDGNISIDISSENPVSASIALRVPGWSDGFAVTLNGETPGDLPAVNGYAVISREFKQGDRIEISMEIIPRFYRAHPSVRYDGGKVALKAGPVVYCLEEADNGSSLCALSADINGRLQASPCGEFPVDCMDIAGQGFREEAPPGDALYYEAPGLRKIPADLRFIPYFLWGSRNAEEAREMTVWVRSENG